MILAAPLMTSAAPLVSLSAPLMTLSAPLMTSAAPLVSLHVEREVVRPGEGSVAEVTFEWLGAGVLPVVSCELI